MSITTFNLIPANCLIGVAQQLVVEGDLGCQQYPSDERILDAFDNNSVDFNGGRLGLTGEAFDNVKTFLGELQGQMSLPSSVFLSNPEQRAHDLRELFGKELAGSVMGVISSAIDPVSENNTGLVLQAIKGHPQASRIVLNKMMVDADFFCDVMAELGKEENYASPLKTQLVNLPVPIHLEALLIDGDSENDMSFDIDDLDTDDEDWTAQIPVDDNEIALSGMVTAYVDLASMGNKVVLDYLITVSVESKIVRDELCEYGESHKKNDTFELMLEHYLSVLDDNPDVYYAIAQLASLDVNNVTVFKAMGVLIKGVVTINSEVAADALEKYFPNYSSLARGYCFSKNDYLESTDNGTKFRVKDRLLEIGMFEEVVDKIVQIETQACANPYMIPWIVEEAVQNYDFVCLASYASLLCYDDKALKFLETINSKGLRALLLLIGYELGLLRNVDESFDKENDDVKKWQQEVVKQAMGDTSFMMLLAQFYAYNLDIMPAKKIRQMFLGANMSANEMKQALLNSQNPVKTAFWLSVMAGKEIYNVLDLQIIFDQDLDAQRSFFNELIMLGKYDADLYVDSLEPFILHFSQRKMIRLLMAMVVKDGKNEGGVYLARMVSRANSNSAIDLLNQYLMTGRHRLLSIEDLDMVKLFSFMALQELAKSNVYAADKLRQYQQKDYLQYLQWQSMSEGLGSADYA